MTRFNQSARAVERARAFLADVRAGHVSFADESAPFMTLTNHLDALLEVIDGPGSARASRALARETLAGLPTPGQLSCERAVLIAPSGRCLRPRGSRGVPLPVQARADRGRDPVSVSCPQPRAGKVQELARNATASAGRSAA
jgi:hypothetical protein